MGEEKFKYWGFSYGIVFGGIFVVLWFYRIERMVNDGMFFLYFFIISLMLILFKGMLIMLNGIKEVILIFFMMLM